MNDTRSLRCDHWVHNLNVFIPAIKFLKLRLLCICLSDFQSASKILKFIVCNFSDFNFLAADTMAWWCQTLRFAPGLLYQETYLNRLHFLVVIPLLLKYYTLITKIYLQFSSPFLLLISESNEKINDLIVSDSDNGLNKLDTPQQMVKKFHRKKISHTKVAAMGYFEEFLP